jgi:hypothetical protein
MRPNKAAFKGLTEENDAVFLKFESEVSLAKKKWILKQSITPRALKYLIRKMRCSNGYDGNLR